MPDVPEPTSFALTKNFHITYTKIVNKILDMFHVKKNQKFKTNFKNNKKFHDQPDVGNIEPF